MQKRNDMKNLRDIYNQILGGSYPDRDEYITAIENEHPEWRAERMMKEQEMWIECLDTMLKNFNPRWNPDDRKKSNDWWIYFDTHGKHITPQEVHDYFVKVLHENMLYKAKELANEGR